MKPSSMLACRVGPTWCALPASDVDEILRPGRVEPLASAHAAIVGVALVRGRPTPVLDVRVLLGVASQEGPRRLVSLRVERARGVALAVDEVAGLIDGLALEAAPPLLAEAAEGAIVAMGRLDERLVALLDRARIIDLATVVGGAA